MCSHTVAHCCAKAPGGAACVKVQAHTRQVPQTGSLKRLSVEATIGSLEKIISMSGRTRRVGCVRQGT